VHGEPGMAKSLKLDMPGTVLTFGYPEGGNWTVYVLGSGSEKSHDSNQRWAQGVVRRFWV
ncbi:MAG: hypothetical protein M3017_14635, partial [Actinomycetota bacterium]|nr:hypothetical protein [Actinomycetota bacterium]